MRALVNDTEQVDAAREFDGGTLTLVCQDSKDSAKVQQLCPIDQRRVFTGRWDGLRFIIEPSSAGSSLVLGTWGDTSDADELARLKAMELPDLKTLAATRNVPWDKKASLETMIDRIAAAANK